MAGLPHVELDESCVMCGAVRDDSFHQIWSCFVISAIPHHNVRKSQHLFQRAKREKNTCPCFWTRGSPSRVDGGAFGVAEPLARRNPCDTLEEWVLFLDGTGGPFSSDPVLRRCGWGLAVLDFTGVFAPSLVFGRGGGLLVAKQTVPRSKVYARTQALRFAPRKTP